MRPAGGSGSAAINRRTDFGAGVGIKDPACLATWRRPLAQAIIEQTDGQMGDVDADPLAVELLGGMNGGAADAERVPR